MALTRLASLWRSGWPDFVVVHTNNISSSTCRRYGWFTPY
jgi:hypothetical protein